ncbi:MAG TPA: beta-Ig-H3/fasciclin, partial [Planctomycetaceae bacterium]|nr:beta-Ig-H3/fasciclin [Planctomycetaceae bacterium]
PEGKKYSATEAREKIKHAVARGANLYNCGDYHATTQLYQKTMQDVLKSTDSMPATIRMNMKHALSESQQMNCVSQQAWRLRNALDHAYTEMSSL